MSDTQVGGITTTIYPDTMITHPIRFEARNIPDFVTGTAPVKESCKHKMPCGLCEFTKEECHVV